MADYEIALKLVVQVLENRRLIGAALFFPEFSSFREKHARLAGDVRKLAAQVVKDLPANVLHSRHVPGEPQVGDISVSIEPPRRNASWLNPVSLEFGVVRWFHSSAGPHLAYVPVLGIEVVAATESEREALLAREIRAALTRCKALGSLRELVWLQRCRRVRLLSLACRASRPGLKQTAIAERDRLKRVKSVLREVATDLTRERLGWAYEREELVTLVAEALGGTQPRSVLLVGPSGVGKTAIVDEFVRCRDGLGFRARSLWRTSGSRLIAGMWGFGMWEERCRALCREAVQTRAIMHLGNLIELMEVGKSGASGLGIAGLLRPALVRGELLAIVECTPEELALVERTAPAIVDAFFQIDVRGPEEQQGRRILERVCADLAAAERTGDASQPLLVSPDALDAIDRLHRRYATYSAFPGRPVRFLQNLLRDAALSAAVPGDPKTAGTPCAESAGQQEKRLAPLARGDVLAAFSRETGLPRFLLDPFVPFEAEGTRAWFSERVIGQRAAVDLMVDLLATVKAGLARPRRPLASLLFIGPTGVGKTEMSKTLAEFLFGSPDRLTRFDMSEFADRVAANRLIGGVFGAEGLLTAKVREQPFSVLLFDEVEKAAPEFFDLLLQILGEGRLTDAGGRLADFCNCVVIMTSNLGAETFRLGSVGFGGDAAGSCEAVRHFEEAVRAFVRPELFNRIDRIVPFAALNELSLLQIAGGQLERVCDRDGIRFRGVDLRLDSEVHRFLAARGFDPRYGARPLKRQIERDLLAPLAEQLNRYAADVPLDAAVCVDSEALRVTVKARPAERGRPAVAVRADEAIAHAAQRIVELRRQQQRLEMCSATVDLQNELYRLTELERRLIRAAAKSRDAANVWSRPENAAAMSRLARLRDLAADIGQMGETIVALEEASLCRLYGDIPAMDAQHRLDFETTFGLWELLLLKLYAWQFPDPNRLLLVVFSEEPSVLFELAAAYFAAASQLQFAVSLYQFAAVQVTRLDVAIRLTPDAAPALWRRAIEEPEDYLASRPPGAIGLALALRGPAALPRFGPESGLHEFIEPERKLLCLVETTEQEIVDYKPPADIKRRGMISGPDRRRKYDRLKQEIVEDPPAERLEWFGRSLNAVLLEATERRLKQGAYSLLGD